MSAESVRRATIDDLYRTRNWAELVDGKIIYLTPAGDLPSHVSMEIMCRLDAHAQSVGVGDVYMSKLAYVVRPPLRSGRESFSPDCSYYVGPHPANPMHFIEGPPTFAVEVRNEEDYFPDALPRMVAKRADYFEAGTLAVWDVDPIAETVTLYTAADPTNGVVFRRGDVAHAEPAVPGWRMAVDDIFA